MKPSVSKIIGLLDKPAIINWANKIGLQGIKIEDYRNNAMKSGTSLHKQIENFYLNGIPFENKELENNYFNFFKDKEILEIEKNIETDYFIGRLDIKIKYKNKVYICDFKSNQKYIYFENKLQLIAYNMADNCDNLAIISIPDFNLIELNILDYKPYEKILINLSEIYNLKNLLND
jgi:hypothetical protein